MARGYEENRERLRLLGLLGKALARRSGRRCELCQAAGIELRLLEVPPVPREPEIERTLLLCLTCIDQARDPRKMDPARWRCLESVVWSTEPAVQVMALRLLRRLERSTDWAAEALEGLEVDPEVEDWAGAGS